MRIRDVAGLVLLLAGCSTSRVHPTREPSSTSFCGNFSKLELHAHRGAADRPENMLTAFRRGFEQGADLVEMDLQITKDNRVVVAHDPFIKAECARADGTPLSRPLFYRELNLSEVKALDCGSRVPPGVGPVAGEKVSTLEEVIVALKDIRTERGEPARLNIEIKYDPARPQYFPSRKDYVGFILDVIRKTGLPLSQFMIQSFDVETLAEVHRQWNDVSLSPLLGDRTDGIAIARAIGAKTVTPSAHWVTPEMLATFHAAGIRVIPWTVNDALQGARLVEWGVDGIISDRAEWYALARKSCGR